MLVIELNDPKFERAWSQSVFSNVTAGSEKVAAGPDANWLFTCRNYSCPSLDRGLSVEKLILPSPFFVSAFHKSALWCLLLFIWYLPALNLRDLCVALLKDAKEIFTPSFLCKWAHYLCTLQAYVCIHHFKHTRQDCYYEWLTAAQNRISCLFLIYCIFIS